MTEPAQERRHITGQPIDADQDGQATRAGANQLDQRGDQDQVTVAADDAPQPQARRYGHRQRHLHSAPNQLHPQLVGLDVLQVGLALLDDVLMHLSPLPPGEGEGGDEGRNMRVATLVQGLVSQGILYRNFRRAVSQNRPPGSPALERWEEWRLRRQPESFPP